MPDPGDVVLVDFPGVTGVKRRPAVVLSSALYHSTRPDVIVGLVTSRAVALGPTDCTLQDWSTAGLRVPSVFRSFLVTIPRPTHLVVVGQLSAGDWKAVRNCVLSALARLDDPT